MSDLKTIEKKNPEFLSYLLGTFSDTHRAIPITSLNVSTENESVTFEIKLKNEIHRPGFFVLWSQILKFKNLPLLILPIFLVLTKNAIDGIEMDFFLASESAAGAILLLFAVSLRNDVRDHISGLDRVHPTGGARAIQKGWITAQYAKKLSVIFFILSVLCGIVPIIVYPKLLFFIVAMAITVLMLLSNYKYGVKYRFLTEFAVLMLFGPLLTVGYELASSGHFDFETFFLGIITGWFSVYIFHLKNFESIFVSHQVGIINSITRLGFEKSKRLISLWWICFVLFLNLYHLIYSSKVWSFVLLFISGYLSFILIQQFKKIPSPVSSRFRKTIQAARSIGFILIAIWIVENLSYLLIMEIGSGT